MVSGREPHEATTPARQTVVPTSCPDCERGPGSHLLAVPCGYEMNAMELIMNRKLKKDAEELSTYLGQFDREQLLELGAKLYKMAKKQCQTGFDDRGQPVTQEHFRTLNEMRKILNDRGAS